MCMDSVSTILNVVSVRRPPSVICKWICLKVIAGSFFAKRRFKRCSILTPFVRKAGKNSSRLDLVACLRLIGNWLCIKFCNYFNWQAYLLRSFPLLNLTVFMFSGWFLVVFHLFFFVFVFFLCTSLFGWIFLWDVLGQAMLGVAYTAPTFSLTDVVTDADFLEPSLRQIIRDRSHGNLDLMWSGSGRPVSVHNTVVSTFHRIQ